LREQKKGMMQVLLTGKKRLKIDLKVSTINGSDKTNEQ